MEAKLHGYLAIGLLLLLLVVLVLDPRVPGYRSSYDPPATRREVEQWARDIKQWRRSPTWEHFRGDSVPPSIGAPDFAASYIFGKYDYRVDVQIRGDNIQYISWGNDDQEGGGAWYAVGEGRLNNQGEWFSVWSCLDLSRAVSNGGGAWFTFSDDRTRINVRYYHDTLPFGDHPQELGEAVQVSLAAGQEMPADRASVIVVDDWKDRPLEGRVRAYTEAYEAPADDPFVLWGRVVDEQGEGLGGAAVKRRAAGKVEALTDSRGFFKLELEKVEALTLLAAGKLGYTNGIVTLEQDTAFSAIGPKRDRQKVAFATITLRPIDRTDYTNYEWVSPEYTPRASYDAEDHLQCGNCHRREWEAWRTSRHASMATNQWTRAAFQQDARPHALAAGSNTDDCTPCHSPSLAAKLHSYHLDSTTLLDAKGVDLHGNHCDFCHKIERISVVESPGMNGSIRLLRPNPHDDTVPGNIKRVFGPLPDVSFLYMGASYNPVFEMGLLCAGCHEHQLDDRRVAGQSTYSEWRQTRYAQPGEDYKECQSCHMPQYVAGEVRMVPDPRQPGKMMQLKMGGDLKASEVANNGAEIARYSTRYRPLNESHKHSFVGTEDPEFLKAAISMQVETETLTDGLRVRVTLENTGAGHAVPTGHGLKRYLLAVTGAAGGKTLAPASDFPPGERIGEAADATQAVLIGRNFKAGEGADWSLPYWRAEAEGEDNRLWPGKPQVFEFDLPGADAADIKLILRRGSPTLLKSHGMDISRGKVAGADLDVVVHNSKVSR
ncbi:MAG: hypothetical protein KDB68_14975 [Planctomycetes bacterium]|nr:hypothetical protein [Planctomycetota bacterium]